MCVTKSVGCGTTHKYTNIYNFYSVKYKKHFTKQYYRLFLHIKSSSLVWKVCIFKFSLRLL